MTKFKGPFDLIRELIKYGNCIKSIHYYWVTGIIDIVLTGQVFIPAQFTEGMKKSRYIQENVFNSIDPDSIDSGSLGDFLSEIEKEDDVPAFICTTLRFKDTELPPLENSEKIDIEALRMAPLKAEFEAVTSHAACSGSNVNTEGEDAHE